MAANDISYNTWTSLNIHMRIETQCIYQLEQRNQEVSLFRLKEKNNLRLNSIINYERQQLLTLYQNQA